MLILIAAALLHSAGPAPALETAPPIVVSAQEPDYRYCYSVSASDSSVVYFSQSFAVEGGTYAVGLENSFNSFVSARFDPRAISGASCMGPYDSGSEASDERNDHIASVRREGKSAVLTHWAPG